MGKNKHIILGGRAQHGNDQSDARTGIYATGYLCLASDKTVLLTATIAVSVACECPKSERVRSLSDGPCIGKKETLGWLGCVNLGRRLEPLSFFFALPGRPVSRIRTEASLSMSGSSKMRVR